MRNRFLFMMVAILAVASNVLADNGLGTRTDNGLGTFITNGLGTLYSFITNGLGT